MCAYKYNFFNLKALLCTYVRTKYERLASKSSPFIGRTYRSNCNMPQILQQVIGTRIIATQPYQIINIWEAFNI